MKALISKLQNFAPLRHKTVFVTVGTTEFDDLISAVTKPGILESLASQGFTKLLLQIGRCSDDAVHHEARNNRKVNVETYRFKPSLKEDIDQAFLVIGHAGAGTCLEVLEARKLLLVVVNEKLHDNHQLELARQLEQDKHLKYCTPESLRLKLDRLEVTFSDVVPFSTGNPGLFSRWLDKRLNIAC